MFRNSSRFLNENSRIGVMDEDESSNNKVHDSKVGGSLPRRKALGDITNAYNENNTFDNDQKNNPVLKKTVFSSIPFISEAQIIPESSHAQLMPVSEERLYMQRPSDDIDARDVDNPLLCTAMVNEMYENFNILEKEYAVSENYLVAQPYVNDKMRTILVDWLVEVHLKFKMVPETLYLTVNLIDRYLEKKQVRRSKLQLVGVAALLLSSKYEEIYPPELRDLVYITDRAYNKQDILEMESDIVNTLDYHLTVPTIHSFLCRYLKAAHADRTMVQLACYLCERTLQEYSMCEFLPSTIAATAVLIARKSLKVY
jgi:cyclin B